MVLSSGFDTLYLLYLATSLGNCRLSAAIISAPEAESLSTILMGTLSCVGPTRISLTVVISVVPEKNGVDPPEVVRSNLPPFVEVTEVSGKEKSVPSENLTCTDPA